VSFGAPSNRKTNIAASQQYNIADAQDIFDKYSNTKSPASTEGFVMPLLALADLAVLQDAFLRALSLNSPADSAAILQPAHNILYLNDYFFESPCRISLTLG
jgi:hypothetical protein